MINKPKRILVIRLSAMGDVAIMVPAIDAMRRQHSEIELYILSNVAYSPFFENLPGIKFIGIRTQDYKGLKGLRRLYKEMGVYGFQLVADLHNVIRSKILRTMFRLAGVPVIVIDKGRKGKRSLTRKSRKRVQQLETSAERYTNVFRKAGFSLNLDFKTIYPNGVVLSERVSHLIGDKKPVIGIAPFAKHKGKIYPIAEMEKVVKYFDEQGVPMFLFGGGSVEKAVLDGWADRYACCTSLVGQLTFAEELQLISRLNVMLSMDSGNMHLASLVATPVVSVWGATHPYAGFYGWGQKPDDIVQATLSCRPCSVYGSKDCSRHDYACMAMITPEMIIEKVKRYL